LPPIASRTAMCVGKCSRVLGPSLLVLGTVSVAANVLLLFPGGAAKYLLEGHISQQAKAVPGIWGGGLSVLLAAAHITAVGWRSPFWCPTSPPLSPQAFISAVLSKLALLGAASCFVLCGVGLTNGPLCFYNTSRHGPLWGYPFLDGSGQEPDSRVQNYLQERRMWSVCLEPQGVVAWNVALFSLLLLVSASEMALASLHIINGCLGCLCGFCEGK
ncbi:T4S1 protein, partial [Urocolius indicus]|nr:T4S1 protein [Urocolius indicus]